MNTSEFNALFAQSTPDVETNPAPLHPASAAGGFEPTALVQTPREVFTRMDADLIRVLEDLVFVLIDKGVITITDLPPHAQAKLLDRKGFRDRFTRAARDSQSGDFIDALDDSRFGLMR